MKKIIIFGLGQNFKKHIDNLCKHFSIIAVSDNNSDKLLQHKDFNTISPDKISSVDFDYICITNGKRTVAEITNQLISLGIPESKLRYPASRYESSPFLIDPMFFEELSAAEKKVVFKNNVELIWIEPNSKCNRKCWFCPNAQIDRHSNNHIMDRELLVSILKDLESIDYDGDVSLSYYNEALLDEGLESKIELIKSYIPNCMLHLNTNGDYLTRERMISLKNAGLDRLLSSNYILNSKEDNWDWQTAHDVIEKRAVSLGIKIDFFNSPNGEVCSAFSSFDNMGIAFDSMNFNLIGLSRGNLVDGVPHPKRSKVCADPYHAVPIDNVGRVMLCVNCHSNAAEHKPYFIGDVNEASIFDIFVSDKMTEFRKKLLTDINHGICAGCNNKSQASILNLPNQEYRGRPRERCILTTQMPS